MDTQQFQKFLEIQARQQEQITQILQQLIRSQNVSASQSDSIEIEVKSIIKNLIRSQNVSASQSDSIEIEVKSIIKNLKCEKYDSNTAAETFIDYFEAQCRMWGLENKPDKDISKKFLSLFQIKTTRFKALTNFWNCTREKRQTFENYANKRLYLACDASEKGIGELLFHMNEEGEEEPIAFASRVLNDAEKNYSVIASNNIADFLSRFPNKHETVSYAEQRILKVYEDCCNRKLNYMELTEGLLRKETSADHILKNIKQFVQMNSWNSKITKELQPFYDKRNEIFLENEKQWSPAKVIDRTNKYSYKVVTNNGVERSRHTDHIRERNDDLPLIDDSFVIDTSELLSTEVPNENQEKIEITTPQNLEPEINDFSIVSVPGTTTSQTETTQLRRSTRIRTIPRRYPE
ncbi:RNase H-like domain found in reverse transcriptase [Popillia japonica]|uniref:RNase H-like domain found in reverse transcriptase n=1 Tax=Popillia japonica TaxID=7064 RepID=A0AAW1HS97_POPJA